METLPGVEKEEMQDFLLDRALPAKGQRPRGGARVGRRWWLQERKGRIRRERWKGGENIDCDAETQVQRNLKTERDRSLGEWEPGEGTMEKQQQKEANTHLEKKREESGRQAESPGVREGRLQVTGSQHNASSCHSLPGALPTHSYSLGASPKEAEGTRKLA